MPKSHKPQSAEQVLALFQQLSFEDQQKVRKALKDCPARESFLGAVWVTVSEAASYSGKGRSQISRDCRNKKFPTNGMQWRDLRVCLWSVLVSTAWDISTLVGAYFREVDDGIDAIVYEANRLSSAVHDLRPGKRSRARKQAERLCLNLGAAVERLREERLHSSASRRSPAYTEQAFYHDFSRLFRALKMADGLELGLWRLDDLDG
jgi:hypothetical protein